MKRNFLLMRFFASLPAKHILCLGGAILAASLFVFFTARGMIQMNQLKADRDRMKTVISQLREDNRKLVQEIESLHTLEGIEKRARELGLVGKDELLYIF